MNSLDPELWQELAHDLYFIGVLDLEFHGVPPSSRVGHTSTDYAMYADRDVGIKENCLLILAGRRAPSQV